MSERNVNLDRIVLDGTLLHRRSATLRFDPGADGSGPSRGWSVHVLGRAAPAALMPSQAALVLEATTAAGHRLSARVQIVERSDNERGTRLVLTGSGPIDGLPDQR